MDGTSVLVTIGAAALSGGGIAAWITASVARRKAPADIAAQLSAAAMMQVDQLQERVQEAETSARNARVAAESVEAHMREVQRLADAILDKFDRVARWIHDPSMTIEVLRKRVPLPRNGTSPDGIVHVDLQ